MPNMLNLKRSFVGVALDLITIDLSPISGPSQYEAVLYISNNQRDIIWGTKVYRYLPCKIDGVSSGPSNQSATATISNIESDMITLYKNIGAFAGGYVRRIRTFVEHLAENGGNGGMYNSESWKILQLSSMNREEIILSLGSDLSEDNAVIPVQMMKREDYPGLTE